MGLVLKGLLRSEMLTTNAQNNNRETKMEIFAAYLAEETLLCLKTGSSMLGIIQVHSQNQTSSVL